MSSGDKMNINNPNEIIYEGATMQDDTKLLSNFPIMLGLNTEGKPEGLLLHCFKINNEPDYIVVGKFAKNKLPSFSNKLDKRWFEQVQHLVQDKDLQADCHAFTKEYLKLKDYPIMNNLLLTQEGFDLLSGKFLYTKNGRIQRTVQLECITDEDNLIFGKKYYPVNQQNKLASIALFDTWENYHHSYFMNAKDLENLNKEKAVIYALINNRRMLRYMNEISDGWIGGHYDPKEERVPGRIGAYSLQLLDVVTSFQTETDTNEATNSAPKRR